MKKLKYHKFLIYFGLWALAVISAAYAAIYYSGIMYSWAQSIASAESIYSYYGKGLKILDSVYATLLVVSAAVSVIGRYRIKAMTGDGVLTVCALFALQGLFPLIYSVSAYFITKSVSAVTLKGVLTLVFWGTVSAVTFVYYKKRGISIKKDKKAD